VTKGEDHLDTLMTRSNMAFSLLIQQRFFDALSMFEKLLEKQTRFLPLDHPNTQDDEWCGERIM
jgi:hypothetical protein